MMHLLSLGYKVVNPTCLLEIDELQYVLQYVGLAKNKSTIQRNQNHRPGHQPREMKRKREQ
jgi:hypothetical protein